ncbi:MAG: AraC family transcriptional regulator ligand-binding domain-containing protein [Pseudomonadota bacterium]|nr:AraC family transcriptional regulator ligand-binding domain-containing protein [Pseudomonadota bacterium]
MILPWVEFTSKEGAPSEALLERAGIRPELLQQPDAVVPLKRAFRWIELAGQSLDTEQLGVHVGCVTPIDVLGPYGRILAGALTLNQYLRQGIALYRMIVTGQTVWLSAHGNRVRVNLGAPWKPGPGDCQARLNFLAITIANIRRFAGPYWRPTELSFGFKPREPVLVDVFGDARVVYRPGQTYFEFPRSLLGLRLGQDDQRPAAVPPISPDLLPSDLSGLVELQIASLLCGRTPPVDLIAETLGLSRRSLQRGLATLGVSYTDLLAMVRLRRAADWLERTDKPVIEIAFDLGYTDSSNFARAFRRETGSSPAAFRETAGRL